MFRVVYVGYSGSVEHMNIAGYGANPNPNPDPNPNPNPDPDECVCVCVINMNYCVHTTLKELYLES